MFDVRRSTFTPPRSYPCRTVEKALALALASRFVGGVVRPARQQAQAQPQPQSQPQAPNPEAPAQSTAQPAPVAQPAPAAQPGVQPQPQPAA